MIDPYHPKRIDWFQFRKRTTPVIWPIAYYFLPFTKPGNAHPPIATVAQLSFDHHDRQTLMDQKSYASVQRWLVRRILRNPAMMSRQIGKSRAVARLWLSWCRRSLSREQLRTASPRGLVSRYKTYQRWYERFSAENVFFWLFAEDEVIKALDRRLHRFIPDAQERSHALQILTMPLEASFIEKSDRALYRAAATVRRSSRGIQQAADRLAQQYGWIPWDYVGPTRWTSSIMRRRLLALTPKRARDLLNGMDRKVRQRRSELRHVERLYGLPASIRHLASATRAQATLQDDKKAVTTESHFWLAKLHSETARRLHAKRVNLYFASFDEISNALVGGTKLPNMKRRSMHGVNVIQAGVETMIDGQLARQWRLFFIQRSTKKQLSVSGVTASSGQATGTIRIVLTSKDIKNVKQGDILVTMMTTPEYVPAMKKAAAFVTDEGGLTSHAAIIAREMKKPCIIGTKIATQVLKDGDSVEVDATKGIVRKL